MSPRRVRAALLSDLNPISEIEHACFGNPWPLDAYAQELERDTARVQVAEQTGEIIGFSCCWHVVGEAHLLRIATAPDHRRRGVGRDLLGAVVAGAENAECEHITLEVASRNRPAVALYLASGFVEIGRRSGYYRSPPDDAVVMRKGLVAPE